MPTITFTQDALRKYLKAEASEDELRQAMTMIGTDIDSFGEEIVVEIFPNRPDLLSVPGMARALNQFLGADRHNTYKATKGEGVVRIEKAVKDVRPHTRCAIVRGLSFDDAGIKQVMDLQEKLHITFGRQRKKLAIGIYPLDKITLPITYTAEPRKQVSFVPLESDTEMDIDTLLAEHPTGKKHAHLLEGHSKVPVFRDAGGQVLSVPPIINSATAGKIEESTSDVFVECSGHDARTLEQALRMIVCALIDMGGEAETMTIQDGSWDIISPDLSPKEMRVDLAYVSQRSSVPEERLAESLARMGIELRADTAIIPPYRTDFLHSVDVVEDAAIGYGYGSITPRVPEIYTAGKLADETRLLDAVRRTLSGLQMQEVMNYLLTADGVRLANPLTQEYSSLRTELLTGMLGTLMRNVNNTYPQRIFEAGTVFSADPSEQTRVSESLRTATLIATDGADYTLARQTIEALARVMAWHVEFSEHEDPRFLDGRCAAVTGDITGVVGELHPRELQSRQVQVPVCGWEITLPQRK